MLFLITTRARNGRKANLCKVIECEKIIEIIFGEYAKYKKGLQKKNQHFLEKNKNKNLTSGHLCDNYILIAGKRFYLKLLLGTATTAACPFGERRRFTAIQNQARQKFRAQEAYQMKPEWEES